jgi:hypothetical protein
MRSIGNSVHYFVHYTSIRTVDLAEHEASIMYHRDNHVVPIFSRTFPNAASSEAVFLN